MTIDSVIELEQLDALVALAAKSPPGNFVEVGVYRGGSAARLSAVASRRGCTLHLFDTFTGIPCWSAEKDGSDGRQIGDFGDVTPSDLAAIRALPSAVVHVGIFPETLPPDLADLAFVHVDCDQYASIRACIDHLYPLMVPGGTMVFDDYPYLPGARHAIGECFSHERLIVGPRRSHVVKI